MAAAAPERADLPPRDDRVEPRRRRVCRRVGGARTGACLDARLRRRRHHRADLPSPEGVQSALPRQQVSLPLLHLSSALCIQTISALEPLICTRYSPLRLPPRTQVALARASGTFGLK